MELGNNVVWPSSSEVYYRGDLQLDRSSTQQLAAAAAARFCHSSPHSFDSPF